MTIKKELLQSPKNLIFPKRSPMLLVQKCIFFHYLFSLKIIPEIRFNNNLDRTEISCNYKKKTFQRLKNGIFSKGLTHAFSQKMPNFPLFSFSPKTNRNNA